MAPRLIHAVAHPAGAVEIVYAGAHEDDVCLIEDEAGLATEVDGLWQLFGRDLGLDLLDHAGNARRPWRVDDGNRGAVSLDLDPAALGERYAFAPGKAPREPLTIRHQDPFTGGATPVQDGRRYRVEVEAAAAGGDLMLSMHDRQGRLLDTVRRKLPAPRDGQAQALDVEFDAPAQAVSLEIVVSLPPSLEGRAVLGRPKLGPVQPHARCESGWLRLPRAAVEQLRLGGAGEAVARWRSPVPPHLLDGATHDLMAHVAGHGGALEVAFPGFRCKPPLRLSKAGLERASVVRVAGRAAIPGLQRLELQVWVDGRPGEIHRAKARDGKVDARLPIPREHLDGRRHLVEVREARTQAVLFAAHQRTAAFHTRWPVLQLHAQPPLSPESSPARNQHLRAFRAWNARAARGEPIPPLLELHQELLAGPRRRPTYPPLRLPMAERPQVSVIVPARDKFEVTQLALAALAFAPVEAGFEVILVDDGSRDETARIEQRVERLRVVRHEHGLGFVAACNAGAAAARGEQLVFLNNDTEVTAGWLDELLAAFERFDRVGLAGAKLIYPDGRLQEAGGIVWGSGDPWNAGRGAEPAEPAWNYAREVDYVSGAAVMVPAGVWRELGGFSQEFAPAYFEDTDLAMKVRASGRRVIYVPNAEVFHYEGQTAGVDKAAGAKRFQEVNRPKFKRKWRDLYGGRRAVGDRPDLEKDRDALFRALVLAPRLNGGAGEIAKAVRALGGKPTLLPLDLRRRAGAEALERAGVEVPSAPFVRDLPGWLKTAAADFDAILLTDRELEPTIRRLLGGSADRLVTLEPAAEAKAAPASVRAALARVEVYALAPTPLAVA